MDLLGRGCDETGRHSDAHRGAKTESQLHLCEQWGSSSNRSWFKEQNTDVRAPILYITCPEYTAETLKMCPAVETVLPSLYSRTASATAHLPTLLESCFHIDLPKEGKVSLCSLQISVRCSQTFSSTRPKEDENAKKPPRWGTGAWRWDRDSDHTDMKTHVESFIFSSVPPDLTARNQFRNQETLQNLPESFLRITVIQRELSVHPC